jgi:hypothetical protein
MTEFHPDEYTEQVMEATIAIREALGTTEFSVGVNALVVVLSECGMNSTMSMPEFMESMMMQIKHLMGMMENDQVTH